jgi:dolichyl-phosphate beta-glucosyltransferase
MDAVELSVVIPAFNEASRLGDSLERLLPFLEKRGESFEVMVVDDGSADATVDVAREYAHRGVWVLELARNRGKGAALRHGVVASSGAKVLLCDADLSTPIEELARLEPYLTDAKLVLGSRDVEGARVELHQPWHRELMGKAFNLLIRALGFGDFRDTQCGFKLMRAETGRELLSSQVSSGFAFDVELLLRAQLAGMRVEEVPVTYVHDPRSQVRIARASARMVLDVARLGYRVRPRGGLRGPPADQAHRYAGRKPHAEGD